MSEHLNGVVIHITSGNVGDWNQALRNISNLHQDDSTPTPPDLMTVVVNGSAVRFLRSTSAEADQLRRAATAGVRIHACERSLDRLNCSSEALAEGVETVPSGVAEAVRLQQNDHAYLKLP